MNKPSEGLDSPDAHVQPMARQLANFKKSLKAAGIPAIYVNDNFGRWRSDFRDAVRRCGAPDAAGADIVAQLRPRPTDYFVLKPHLSAFFDTPLDLLLRRMRMRHVVLAGIAGDGCIAATATDAHMREYRVTVARDATASQRSAGNRRALEQLRVTGTAQLATAASIVRALRRRPARRPRR